MKKFLSALFLVLSQSLFAAQITFTDLPESTAPGTNDIFPMTIGGNSRKVTINTLQGLVNANGGKLLYVMTNGNDTTAQKGRMDKPWATITNALLSFTNNDTMIIYQGRYVVTPKGSSSATETNMEPIKIYGVTNINLIGIGNPIIYGAGRSNFMKIEMVTNFNLTGVTFDADYNTNRADNFNWTTIYIRGTNENLRFNNIQFLNQPDNVLTHYPSFNGEKASVNILVEDCYFKLCGTFAGGDGTPISPGTGWIVKNNIMDNCYRGIELEGVQGGSIISNTVITGNIIRNLQQNGVGIFVTDAGGTTNNFQDIIISDNTIDGPSGSVVGIYTDGLNKDIIVNNRVNFCNIGITLYSSAGECKNNIITGNSLSEQSIGIAIASGAYSNLANIVSMNNIFNCYDVPIDAVGISEYTFSDNVIYGVRSGGQGAFKISGPSDRNRVYGNTVNSGNVSTYGLVLNATTSNTWVFNNSFVSNSVAMIQDLGNNNRFAFNQWDRTNVTGTFYGTLTNVGDVVINRGGLVYPKTIPTSNAVALVTIDATLGSQFTYTNAVDATVYWVTNLVDGKQINVIIVNGVGLGYTFSNYSFGPLWSGDIHPPMSTNTSIVTFIGAGTNVYASGVTNFNGRGF